MAARTYAPQFARILQHAYSYWGKHQAKITAVASAQQVTDAQAIVAAIANSWNAVATKEQP